MVAFIELQKHIKKNTATSLLFVSKSTAKGNFESNPRELSEVSLLDSPCNGGAMEDPCEWSNGWYL